MGNDSKVPAGNPAWAGLLAMTAFLLPLPKGEAMKISREEVEHVALLARLKFSEEEKGRFTFQMNSILEYMEKLGELDTARVEPTFHAVTRSNVFREDVFKPSLPRDLTLSNAPDGGSGLFQVPKIIE